MPQVSGNKRKNMIIENLKQAQRKMCVFKLLIRTVVFS